MLSVLTPNALDHRYRDVHDAGVKMDMNIPMIARQRQATPWTAATAAPDSAAVGGLRRAGSRSAPHRSRAGGEATVALGPERSAASAPAPRRLRKRRRYRYLDVDITPHAVWAGAALTARDNRGYAPFPAQSNAETG